MHWDVLFVVVVAPVARVVVYLVRTDDGVDPVEVLEQVDEASGGRAAGAVDAKPYLVMI